MAKNANNVGTGSPVEVKGTQIASEGSMVRHTVGKDGFKFGLLLDCDKLPWLERRFRILVVKILFSEMIWRPGAAALHKILDEGNVSCTLELFLQGVYSRRFQGEGPNKTDKRLAKELLEGLEATPPKFSWEAVESRAEGFGLPLSARTLEALETFQMERREQKEAEAEKAYAKNDPARFMD